MSIKLRLILSYIAMLVIPVILTLFTAALLSFVYTGDIHNLFLRGLSAQEVNRKASDVFAEIEQMASTDPDRFQNRSYLDRLDVKLRVFNIGITVGRGNQLIFKSPFINESSDGNSDLSLEKSGDIFSKALDFRFSDGVNGSILVTTDIRPIGRLAASYFSTLVILALIILILTNGILTFMVSRSIIKPLNVLRHATRRIKAGDLDFEIRCYSKDEVGQLCSDFEEMRCRLKNSVLLQMQYEENRKELLSNISHDLKTPLTAIKGYVEGIIDGIADSPGKIDQYAKTAYSKITAMDEMIDDLFLFSKLDLARQFDFDKIDIKQFCEDCMEELKVDLAKKNITIDLFAEGFSSVFVSADADKLKRVVVNIVDNSVKYMDKEKGEIKLTLYDEPEFVKVKITDNGRGIKQEDLEKIFDRFYRGDPSRSSAIKGSGLGLAIVKQVIEGHGGKVWVRSEYGIGTSVFFTLKKA